MALEGHNNELIEVNICVIYQFTRLKGWDWKASGPQKLIEWLTDYLPLAYLDGNILYHINDKNNKCVEHNPEKNR